MSKYSGKTESFAISQIRSDLYYRTQDDRKMHMNIMFTKFNLQLSQIQRSPHRQLEILLRGVYHV